MALLAHCSSAVAWPVAQEGLLSEAGPGPRILCLAPGGLYGRLPLPLQAFASSALCAVY